MKRPLLHLLLLLVTNSIFAISMQEAEQRALESSPAIRLGNLQSEQNDAQYAQALLSWFPEITFGSMAAILQKSQKISHLQKQKHLFSNQFTLTQPIFSSDLLGNLKLSRLIKEGGAVGKEMAISDTLYAVRTQYILYGMKNQELALEHVKLAFLQQVYQDETIRLKTGRSTQLQVAKAKAAISYEISKQMDAQKESTEARHELALLLHLPPQEEAGLKVDHFPSIADYPLLKEKQRLLQNYLMKNTLNETPPKLSLFNEEEINNLLAKARANRPELKKTRLYVQAADAKKSQSHTQYLPEVSAFVDYGYYQPVNGQFFRQRNDWAGGVQLSWSLFDSLKREMKSKETVAFRKAALIAYEFENDKLEITIRHDTSEIEEALFLYQNSQENLYLAQQTLEEAEVQFGAGSLSELQLQDAKKFLSESEFGQTQALSSLLQKYYQLQHDIGVDLN
ncbi:MAG: TolC family protein [Rhabdochlamydiaceae bacterium]|nr:TolC family protein [Rhabdochlamydiaceae bacterium]